MIEDLTFEETIEYIKKILKTVSQSKTYERSIYYVKDLIRAFSYLQKKYILDLNAYINDVTTTKYITKKLQQINFSFKNVRSLLFKLSHCGVDFYINFNDLNLELHNSIVCLNDFFVSVLMDKKDFSYCDSLLDKFTNILSDIDNLYKDKNKYTYDQIDVSKDAIQKLKKYLKTIKSTNDLTIINYGERFIYLFCGVLTGKRNYDFRVFDFRKLKEKSLISLPDNILGALQINKKIRNNITHCVEELDDKILPIYKYNFEILYNWLLENLDKIKLENKINQKSTKQEDLFEKYKKTIDAQNEKIAKLEKILEEQSLLLDSILNKQSEMETKIDKLAESLEELNLSIKDNKEQLEKSIKECLDKDYLVEALISDFQDKTASLLKNNVEKNCSSNNISSKKEELKVILGEENYSKLTEESISFIITAKITYEELSKLSNEVDYSGVCLLLTKSLEKEIKERFYLSFMDYQYEINATEFNAYPKALLKKDNNGVKHICKVNEFTLGIVPHLLESRTKDHIHPNIMGFCKEYLFKNTNEKFIENYLKTFGNEVDKITKSFRNPSAHINIIKKIKAEECYKYLFEVEKLMQKFLNQVNY